MRSPPLTKEGTSQLVATPPKNLVDAKKIVRIPRLSWTVYGNIIDQSQASLESKIAALEVQIKKTRMMQEEVDTKLK